jgi:hypothetical protein
LLGAGWNETILAPRAANDDAHELAPTILTENANVTLQDLQLNGTAPTHVDEGLRDTALLECRGGRVVVRGCAVVGPFFGGVAALEGADVEIRNTLVAAIWNVGVRCGAGERPTRVRLIDSDVRNCYHRCVAGLGDGSLVERCRISGSAWHGIVLGGSPTIRNNWIFGNARSGIYASGGTRAVVRDNVFWRNEMNGMSCWLGNADLIERNTFVGNLREGIAVIAGARPRLVRNVFTDQPLAIGCSVAGGHGDKGVGRPELSDNVFARNAEVLSTGWFTGRTKKSSGVVMPVEYADAAAFDFTVRVPADRGAQAPIPLASPWPLQPGELAIIPDGDARDFQRWKKPGEAR